MRRAVIRLAAAVMACGIVVCFEGYGPTGRALADDTKLEMPPEAAGFNGVLFGSVVKETDPNGCFDIKVIKVLSFGPGNKTKLNVAALTTAWKDKAEWCRPVKPVNKCEPLKVGDTVVMVGAVFEVHMRYTKVTKGDEPKAEDPPAPKPPTPLTRPPTTAPAALAATAATSQPGQPQGAEEQARGKLKLAQLYIDSGMKDQAKDTLREVIRIAPGSDAAKEAQGKLTAISD